MIETRGEKQNDLEFNKKFVKAFHHERIDLLNQVGVPKGLVINGEIPQEIWSYVKAFIIPLTPGGPDISQQEEAENKLIKVRERYGQDAFFIMVPDEDSPRKWSVTPVLTSDFCKDPRQILSEGFEAISKEDLLLAEIKRSVFMAVTGFRSTKQQYLE